MVARRRPAFTFVHRSLDSPVRGRVGACSVFVCVHGCVMETTPCRCALSPNINSRLGRSPLSPSHLMNVGFPCYDQVTFSPRAPPLPLSIRGRRSTFSSLSNIQIPAAAPIQ